MGIGKLLGMPNEMLNGKLAMEGGVLILLVTSCYLETWISSSRDVQ